MTRERLPDRRPSETVSFHHDNVNYTATFGRDPSMEIKEVFIDAGKVGSGLQIGMNDAATILSVALQNGIKPKDLFKSVRRDASGHPASPIGIILSDMVKANG